MSFIFSQVNGSAIGSSAPEVGAGTFYGTAFDQGWYDSMLSSIYRLSEYNESLKEDPFWNPRLNKDQARQFAQEQGVDLTFDQDPTQDEVNLLIRRHIEKRDREQILTAGAEGTMRTAGQIGVQFLGSVLNPVDLPLMFVPIVGTASKAKGASTLGNALRRGIVTEEALAARGLALRGYTAAVVEGSVGQAITEIPLMFANTQDQTDYTAGQFFGNIALGGAFGIGVKTVQKIFGRLVKAHSRLTPETRENMATGAMDDFIRGEPIDPARFVEIDNNVVKAKATNVKDLLDSETIARHISIDGAKAMEFKDGILHFTLNKSETNVYESWMGKDSVSFKIGDLPNEAYVDPLDFLDSQFPTLDRLTKGGELDNITTLIKSLEPESDFTPEGLIKNRADEWIPNILKERLLSGDTKVGEAFTEYLADLKVRKPELFNEIIEDVPFVVPEIKGMEGKIQDGIIEQLPKAESESVNSLKQREQNKERVKQERLQREIEEGQTLSEEEKLHFEELPTDREITTLEEQIKNLEDELSLAADEWEVQIDALEGNVKSVNQLSTELTRAIHTWSEGGPKKAVDSALDYIRKEAYANPIKSDKPVYRTVNGIDQVKVGDKLTPYQKGFAGWSEGSLQTKAWAQEKGGRFVLSGENVLIPHSKIKEHPETKQWEFIGDDAESFIDDRQDYVVVDIRVEEGVRNIYVEPVRIFDKSRKQQESIDRFEIDMFYSTWKKYLPKSPTGEIAPTKASEVVDALVAMDVDTSLVQEVLELDPTLRDITIKFDKDLLRKEGANGVYIGRDDEIILNGEVSAKTVFHELIHATAVRKFRQKLASIKRSDLTYRRGEMYFDNLKAISENASLDDPNLKGLIRSYLKAVEYHAKKVDPNIKKFLNIDPEKYYKSVEFPHYGLLNFDEFIAEAVSNRQFQFFLNTIPGSKNKTLFREFIDKVKNFFGLPDRPGSLLEQTLEDYYGFISNGSRNPGDYLKGIKTITSADVNQPMIARASTCILNATP